jgi:hypothetical protein
MVARGVATAYRDVSHARRWMRGAPALDLRP